MGDRSLRALPGGVHRPGGRPAWGPRAAAHTGCLPPHARPDPLWHPAGERVPSPASIAVAARRTSRASVPLMGHAKCTLCTCVGVAAFVQQALLFCFCWHGKRPQCTSFFGTLSAFIFPFPPVSAGGTTHAASNFDSLSCCQCIQMYPRGSGHTDLYICEAWCKGT